MEKLPQAGAYTRLLYSYLDLKDLGITYSESQIIRKEKTGTFPRRVRLGENRVAWVAAEIHQWIKSLTEAPRERKPAPTPPKDGYQGGRRKRPAQAATEAA
jgi:prophage regulatory protein